MTDEPRMIIGAPVPPMMPGAVVRWCHICAADVQLSPDGLRRMEAEHLLPVCVECVVPLMAAEEHAHVEPVDPTATEANRVVGDAMRAVVARARAERRQ